MKNEYYTEGMELIATGKQVRLLAELKELPLEDEIIAHFSDPNIKYCWALGQGDYEVVHVGLLIDHTLDYIHGVVVYEEVYNYIQKEIYKYED